MGTIKRRKRSRYYQARWYDADGRLRRESTRTEDRRVARLWLSERESEAIRGRAGVRITQSRALDDAWAEYLDERRPPVWSARWWDTVAWWARARVIPDLGGPRADTNMIRHADAERARLRWLRGTSERRAVKPQTVNRITAVASGFFAWAVARGCALENPFARFLGRDERFREVRAEPPPLGEEEIARFLYAIPNVVLRRAATIQVDSGIAPSELRRARWCDVESTKRLLRVVSSYERGLAKRATRERVVPLSTRAWAALLEQRADAGDDLFAAMPRNYRPSLAAAQRAAGLPRFRWYDLRHYALTRVAAAGLGWRELQDLAGWSSPVQASRYVHPSLERIRAAVDRLGAPSGEQRGAGEGDAGVAAPSAIAPLNRSSCADPGCAPGVPARRADASPAGPDRKP